MEIIKDTKQFILSNKLISKGDTLIAGISGGADSTCLLHILSRLQYEIGFNIHIAHFNHNLRKGARKDQEFVKCLAEKLNVPFSTEKWGSKDPKSQKGSLENKAREQRLKFFLKTAKKNHTNIIALAHTQDDQAETVLMKLIRGSGLQGFRGILAKKEIKELTIIRPLLHTRKKDIMSFLNKNKFQYCTDPTNKQTDFFRNKVRLNLIPLLEKDYNPRIKELLANFAETTANDYEFLKMRTDLNFRKTLNTSNKNSVSLKNNILKKLSISEQRMLIRHTIEILRGNINKISMRHMKEIEDLIKFRTVNSIVDLPDNISVKKSENSLIFLRK